MSSPKFMVFKLKDLKVPLLIALIAVLIFIIFIFKNKTAAQTFAPFDTYQDGKYIAGITLSDADMDIIVEIKDHAITNISLSGLDETSSTLYNDLLSSIDYINTYVTANQSLELPKNVSATPSTQMLMDAIKIALSKDENAKVSSTYEKQDVTASNSSSEIWVDEFEDDTNATQTQSEIAKVQQDTLQTPSDENTAGTVTPEAVVIED